MADGYTKTAHMVWQGDGILRIHILPGAEIDVEEAKENYDLTSKLTSGRKYPSITFATTAFTITPEARLYAAERSADGNNIASAVVTNLLSNRLLGNFYIRFNKPAIPTRMFDSEKNAMEWLTSFLPELKAHVKKDEPVKQEEEEEEEEE